MKIFYLFFVVFSLLSSLAFSQEKTGVLLIGEIMNDVISGKAQSVEWVSTKVTAQFTDGKMVIKSNSGLIPTPMGGIDELVLFGNEGKRYTGGGATMNNGSKGTASPGINGLNLSVFPNPNGFYAGDGFMFYPASGHSVQILVIFDGNK
jgi:hypothetical protein